MIYLFLHKNQRTNGPVNAHQISGPSISINHTKPDNHGTNGPVKAHLISGPHIYANENIFVDRKFARGITLLIVNAHGNICLCRG